MKKIIFSIAILFAVVAGYSQGLENVIVEKYYEASAADASLDPDGNLVADAVTYRIFIDMAAGYRLSSVFGVPENTTTGYPGHTLFFETTTNFINNLDRGDAIANSIGSSRVTDNTVALDSWLSLGASSGGHSALLKGSDSDGSLLSQFTNSGADFTDLATNDGFIAGTPEGVSIIPAALETQINSIFGTGSGLTGPRFEVVDGSWYSFNGATGADSDNMVLVAQITTDGDLSFELNVQLIDAAGNAENWVARDATGASEIQSDLLSFTTVNLAPSVTLDPLASTSFFEGETVSGSAVAADPDGSVAQVEFFIDGVSVTVDNAAPYEFSAPVGAVGTHVITAEVTDDQGTVVASTNNLTYTVSTNATPVAVVTGPVGQIDITGGAQTVNLTATATDAESDPIAGVEFFVNGASAGTDVTAPYEVSYTFNLAGSYEITAQASDDSRQGSVSAPVSVSVVNNAEFYYLGAGPSEGFSKSVPCYEGDQFCVSILTAQPMVDLTGFDIVMKFDASKVTPTGQVALIDSVLTTSYLNADYKMNVKGDSLFLSIFLEGSVGSTDVWTGEGTIACVYFAKNATFGQNETVEFSITKFRESTLNIQPPDNVYYIDRGVASINTFTFETFLDPIFNAYVAFWSDMSPVPGQANDPSYNSTFLRDGNGSTFGNEADENGMVAYDWVTNGSTNLRVDKDVANKVFDGDTILSLIGGQDALITARFLVDYYELNGWYPNAYQVMAMDVNLDGKVTAGDLTEINKRAVQAIQEFAPGVDWLSTRLSGMNAPQYQPSSAFPLDAGPGAGYSKERVPNRSVLQLDIAEDSCQFLEDETFVMILLGDVDGSFKDIVHTPSTSALKSVANNSVVFDLASATYEENFVDVPVRVTGEDINAVDFAIMVNTEKLQFMSVNNLQNVEALSNSISQNVWNTSYSLEGYDTEEPVFSVRFMSNGEFAEEDFTYASAFINGEKVGVTFTPAAQKVTGLDEAEFAIRIYPNPAHDMFQVEVGVEANIELIDMNGRVLVTLENVSEKAEINASDLASGIYMVKITAEQSTVVKRVVINK